MSEVASLHRLKEPRGTSRQHLLCNKEASGRERLSFDQTGSRITPSQSGGESAPLIDPDKDLANNLSTTFPPATFLDHGELATRSTC